MEALCSESKDISTTLVQKCVTFPLFNLTHVMRPSSHAATHNEFEAAVEFEFLPQTAILAR